MYILKNIFYFNHMFFVINIILLFSIDCHFDKGENIEYKIKRILSSNYDEEISENTNECLVSVDEAKKILQ